MKENIFEQIGGDLGKLVAEKQAAYGDSFGRSAAVLMELYPNGIKPEQYGDLLTIARILDKLFRIANQKEAFDESPYRDIGGYCLLGQKRDLDAKRNRESAT